MRASSLPGAPHPIGPGPSSGPLSRAHGLSGVVSILILCTVCLSLYFVGLGSHALSDPDEPYYAVPAREMLDAGQWTVPLFRGELWFDKPILFYWVVLAAYHVMGVSEAAARIGSALAALGGVLLLRVLARRIGMPPGAAFASALILATSLGYAVAARAAITDMTLTFFLILGMLAVSVYLETRRATHVYLAGAAFGLAALTKGPVGVLLPALALSAYAFIGLRRDLFRPSVLLSGAAGMLTTAGPWYVYMALVHRDLLLGSFIEQGNLGRFLQPEHQTFPFYYAVVLGIGLLPWAGALPLGFWRGFMQALRARWNAVAAPSLYPLCWFASVILVFSLSASKLPTYVLPAYPAAALLLGSYWHRLLGAGPPQAGKPGRASAWLGVGIALAALAGLVPASSGHGWQGMEGSALALGGILVAGSVAALFAVYRRSLRAYLACGAATSLTAMLVFVAVALPKLEPFDSTRPLVRKLEASGLAGQVHAAFRVTDVSLDYYLGRDLPRVPKLGQLRREVAASPGALWVIRTSDLEELRATEGIVAKEVVPGPHRTVVRLSPAGTDHGEHSE